MSEFLTLTTDQLRLGDIVHNHGMRIKLDRAPVLWDRERRHGPGTDRVYSFPGLVLNPEEAIAEHAIPRGWLYDSRGEYDHATGNWTGPRPSTRPGWTVQGNHLATWYVSRDHEIDC